VRPALNYGDVCPQVDDQSSPALAFLLQPVIGRQSEDCLRLNVWTPGLGSHERRPVMVWIHGGEFTSGSSQALSSYDGENLAREGNVVVVSVNHRLGALGYLNLADVSGGEAFKDAPNAGMLDLVAALSWVRDTIDRFGGDPGCVTLFGQSGGGLKITTLCAMPAAAGLFHRAVVQSGSQTRLFRADVTARLAEALLDVLGASSPPLDALAGAPAERIVAAAAKAQTRFYKTPALGQNIWSLVGFAPSIDGRHIPSDPYDPDHPVSLSVPLLVGSTELEFNPALYDPSSLSMTWSGLSDRLRPAFGAGTEGLIALFRQQRPDLAPVYLYAVISTAAFNRSNAVEQARANVLRGGTSYLYAFHWDTPVLDAVPHAYHCSELPFVFRNTDRLATATGGGAGPRRLSDQMSRSWIQFARTGDPNHGALPLWPKVTPTTLPCMIFDEVCRLEVDQDQAERAAVGRA
jgi:para-nitrobenzyl esterase